MNILVCILSLFCNWISLKLHNSVKRWVLVYEQPQYMRSVLSLRLFMILSLISGVIATCGLTGLSWYWNIPIYLVLSFTVAFIVGWLTQYNAKLHMILVLEYRPWGIYIWSLTILSFILAIWGYNLQ